MSGCGNYSSEGLVGDGADINHSEIMLCKLRMEVVEGDSRLTDDISLFKVNLKGQEASMFRV